MKVYVSFEDVDIDIYSIKSIERSTRWSEKDDMVKFTLIINNPNRIKIETFTPEYVFEYETEKFRNKKYEELKRKMLANSECKFI